MSRQARDFDMTIHYCPCGKKKRYSSCCLLKAIPVSPVDRTAFKRLHAAYEKLWQHYLVPYIQARPSTIAAMAWEDCFPTRWPRKIKRALLLGDFFNYWLAFTWRPYDRDGDKILKLNQTLIEQCYAQTGESWERSTVKLMEALRESYYSFYRVVELHADGRFTVEDLLLHQTFTVQPYLAFSKVYPETLLLRGMTSH
ncbi:MAG: hypothetical protein GY821_00150 [Gammaproteobacteria bacterium]|nr:hypothetical protein [Gammaproteobacteria bacterium]